MTVLFRCRVEKPLLEKANRVTRDLGTSTPEMFCIFIKEIVRTGKVPVSLTVTSEENVAGSWERRAAALQSFYDKSKAW